ncbi:MAG: TaqI-like C-terminal specificity domain-containing protein, partial [Microcystaceae cyanobacterium]
LVGTYDNQKFYNRHNFNNIIIKEDQPYELKYILALFNSSLLNYWYRIHFDNVNINPSYFRQLPIFPADAQTQAQLVEKVDQILAKNAELNQFREQGYTIRQQRNGQILIEIPYDQLLTEIQKANRQFSTLTLFDAKAAGFFSIPDRCNLKFNISSKIYSPERYPSSIVLRNQKLWLVVENEIIRRYLLNYLKLPQWQGRTWDDIKNIALIPADLHDLEHFFQWEQQRRQDIETLLKEVAKIDNDIDQQVLDLYGITDEGDRQRILGSVNVSEPDDDLET